MPFTSSLDFSFDLYFNFSSMDEGTKTWCETNGFPGHVIKSLVEKEFVTMQTIKAMTAEVITSLDLSTAQRCLLKKAVLTAQSAPSPPTTTVAGNTAVSSQLANDRNTMESSIQNL